MKSPRALLLTLAAALVVTANASAQAWPRSDSGSRFERDLGPRPVFQLARNLVPLGEVLEAINALVPGSHLDTNTIYDNGTLYYIVRWQAARGRILIFRVNAETGQIVGRQG
jgi:uncharacterized membrane protein YkoI